MEKFLTNINMINFLINMYKNIMFDSNYKLPSSTIKISELQYP